MPIGLFTPIRTFDIPAKTLFKVKPDIRFESLPMLSPLYDGFTMRTKFYFIPYRLYIPELRKNKQLPWGSVENFLLPTMTINHAVYTAHNQSLGNSTRISLAGSLLDRLGLVYGEILGAQSFNNSTFVTSNKTASEISTVPAVKFLAYLDCWMRGEYNPQDTNIPVLVDSIGWWNGSDETAPERAFYRFGTYRNVSYDNLRNFVDRCYGYVTGHESLLNNVVDLRNISVGGSADIKSVTNGIFDNTIYPITTSLYKYNPIVDEITQFQNIDYQQLMYNNWNFFTNSVSNVGLLPITYKGDYLNSWYNAEGVARLENYVVNNGDNFITLRQKNADMMLELLASISGNTYVDILQYVFDSYLELKDHPIMIGYDELHFGANEDTTATANTSGEGNGVLGAVASKARDYSNKVKPISVKTKEPGMLMVFSSIIPNVIYYQGVDRFDMKVNWSDLWHPQYDSRGFQGIHPEEYYNPFATSTLGHKGSEIYSLYDFAVEQSYVTPRVPLGWEYMQRTSHLSGAMKLDRFRTWSLRRDYSLIGRSEKNNPYYSEDFYSLGERLNPLTNDSTMEVIRDQWLADLSSTYVKGFDYNIPFANYDAFDNQNFIVNFGFVISQYQPITHTLITKTI